MSKSQATTTPDSWFTQDHYVERVMDNSAITAINADDTLFVAGPPRFAKGSQFIQKLLPIGQVMNFSFRNSAPVQPITTFGSGRTSFVRGKSSVSGSIGRLWLNGRNLLRALYTNAVQSGIDVSKFDDPASAGSSEDNFYANLDSELFYIPFGLGCFFRDKMRQNVAALYIEMVMLNTWSFNMSAGQPVTMESVGFVADRALPIYGSSFLPKPRAGADAPSFSAINETILGIGASMAEIVPNLQGASIK